MEETQPETGDGAPVSMRSKSPGPVMLGRGDVVSRYQVENLLGIGGMGVVHAAYDPKLDRRIALKLLRPRGGPSRRARGRARLLREAQALAQLNHPNVVTVHDVGQHDEQVFIAMEFVQGVTLKAWLKEAPRPWRRVLEVMLAAGRGLVAAHAKNMVHRDFKPENVMLADEGRRVLVMDFGLVTAPEVDEKSEYERSLDLTTSKESITRTGSALGTPAYMAPEQFTGRAGPASDQFGFCVTLFEALYGERPFRGATVQALARAIMRGEIAPRPPRDEVPRWLRDVIVRGLSAKPRDRWPSMQALLVALEDEPRSGRRWLAGGAAGLAVVAASAVAADAVAEGRRHAACEQRASAIDAVWNDEHRERITTAFADSPLPYATDAWDRAAPKLDEAARTWAELRTQACLDEETPVQRLDALDACLDARLGRMENVVEILTQATGDVVQTATALADIDVEACRDARDTHDLPSLLFAPEARAARLQLQQDADYANTLRRMGRTVEAKTAAASVVTRARRLEDDQMLARSLMILGNTQAQQTRYKQAATSIEDAYFVAMEADDRQLAARAALVLIGIYGDNLSELEPARRWARHCQKLLDDVGDAIDQARLDLATGRVELAAGNLDAAESLGTAAARVFTKERGPNAERTIDARMLLVAVFDRQGRVDEALELSRSVLESRIEGLGRGHPETLTARSNLAAALLGAGRLREAEQHLRVAIDAMQPPNLDTVDAMNNLSLVMLLTQRIEEAAALNADVVALRREMLSDDHLHLADALMNAASIALTRHQSEQALRHVLEARSIYTSNLGDETLQQLNSYRLEAAIDIFDGRFEAAVETLEIARALQQRLVPEHPMRHDITNSLAFTLLGLGRSERALANTAPYVDGSTSFDGASEPTRLSLHESHAIAMMNLGRADEALQLMESARAHAHSHGASASNLATADAVITQLRWAVAPPAMKPGLRAKVRSYVETLDRDNVEDRVTAQRIDAWLEKTR